MPVNVVEVGLGALAGLGLVLLVDFLRAPWLRELGFAESPARFGTLYKLRFQLEARLPKLAMRSPGLCFLRLEWPGGSAYAKWEETPNPLQGDDRSGFRPEMVSATFFQPLVPELPYSVPILIRGTSGELEVFSGWWFGKELGYGPSPAVREEDPVRLTLMGAEGRIWTEERLAGDVVRAAAPDRAGSLAPGC